MLHVVIFYVVTCVHVDAFVLQYCVALGVLVHFKCCMLHCVLCCAAGKSL